MSLLEDVEKAAEKATGWKRPKILKALLRERKPQTYRFKDDGLIPNHPKWPFIIYKSASVCRVSRPRRRVRRAVREQRLGRLVAGRHLRYASLSLPHP